MPQPIETKVEDTADVLLPAKSAVKPIPLKASGSQPAVIAAPQSGKQNVPTTLPIPEKTAIEKPADAETFPAIAWKRFLKFKAGEDRTPSSLSNPANQKSLPSPQVKTTEPKTEPSEVSISTPASMLKAATSKP
jgi:hypothetical protein